MGNYDHLLAPLTVAGKTYRNRIGASPVGRLMPMPEYDFIIRDYEQKAEGGCSVVSVGECFVDAEHAWRENEPTNDFTIGGALFREAQDIAAAIKAKGSVAMVEINHCGQSKMAISCDDHIAIGPVDGLQPDGIQNVAMDREMMEHVADNFARCALFMKKAGFDGVIPFCGHGWLLHQFLSPLTNTRTDEYGGSIENRCKFPILVLRKIRAACGNDFIIEPRVSGEEGIPGGITKEETAIFCSLLEKEGLCDIIQVSQGIYREPVRSREFSSMFHETGCNKEVAKYIKQRVNVPVSLVGGINSPELGEELIANGYCDLILLGRELFADVNFGKKVTEGNADEVNHCVRCARCFAGPHDGDNTEAAVEALFRSKCTVNPMYHRDTLCPAPIQPPEKKKTVLVIGGGVAGMQAAICAADRGHQVTLVEKSDALGGTLTFTDTDVHKSQLSFLKNQLIRKVDRRPIEVRLGCEANKELIQALAPESIICAVGANPTVPPIPGIEQGVHVLDVYFKPETIGREVVMVGGGLGGCEAALHLADLGHKVTLIEMADQMAAEGEKLHRDMLLDLLAQKVTCYNGLHCTQFTSHTVRAVDAQGIERAFPCDTAVYSLGMTPRKNLVEELRQAAGDIPFVSVGDCVKAQQVAQAGFDAYTAAFLI
jgi:2,4-dienoyl-CoA reductase-like NADH-dependent reductase (Old Yellow Enzyme family)/thioredoxin reductase